MPTVVCARVLSLFSIFSYNFDKGIKDAPTKLAEKDCLEKGRPFQTGKRTKNEQITFNIDRCDILQLGRRRQCKMQNAQAVVLLQDVRIVVEPTVQGCCKNGKRYAIKYQQDRHVKVMGGKSAVFAWVRHLSWSEFSTLGVST